MAESAKRVAVSQWLTGSRGLQKVFKGVEKRKKTPFVIIVLYQCSAQLLLFLTSLFLQAP